MKKLLLISISLLYFSVYSHSIKTGNLALRHWNIEKENIHIDGSFSMLKNGRVYIEDAHNVVSSYLLKNLSQADQYFALQKAQKITVLNNAISVKKSNTESPRKLYLQIGLITLFLAGFSIFLYNKKNKPVIKYSVPIIFVGASFVLYSFSKKIFTTTDPVFVNAAFTPFIPNVATSWDNNYFYVESKGIPNHTMMVGISNRGWQQQVPVPQCYIGNNHWSIPLNPVVAATPVPVNASHFLKGAIAIAANGVAIFNYRTNTGIDAFLDGQLDNYGGHCGRADDYHYHTAPMHLYTLGQTTTNLPCAFGLDGYAVYGSVEPDGSAMATLDANHGHYGTNGVYHYHGTAAAPYMIGNMVGVVTEDSNLQIIPQAAAQPVRNENWTPLNGALIISCVPNVTNNGYNLSYTLNGISGYAVNYSWTGTTYTYRYVTPSGTTVTNYNGFSQCTVPLAVEVFKLNENLKIYPNPANTNFQINMDGSYLESEVLSISVIDFKGSLVKKIEKFESVIDIKNLSKGTYFVKIQFSNTQVVKKLIVQ